MKFVFFCLAALFQVGSWAQTGSDARFIEAQEAFRQGNRPLLESALDRMGPHELRPYVENYLLRLHLTAEGIQDPAFLAFFERHDGSLVAERLRADWIRRQAKSGQWQTVVQAYPKLLSTPPEMDLQCYFLHGRRLLGEENDAYTAFKNHWLATLELPEACEPLIQALAQHPEMDPELLWQRARRQMEANRPKQALHTLRLLPTPVSATAFEQLQKSGMSYLARISPPLSQRLDRELMMFALQRIAVTQPETAAQQLTQRQALLRPEERSWIWGQIALQAAKKHHPDALLWFGRTKPQDLSEEGAQWHVRAALRAQDWHQVRFAIQHMPSTLSSRPEWQYWLGRALKQLGDTDQARKQFEALRGQAHFYGNLATEELGHSVHLPNKAGPLTPQERDAAERHPGLRRALAFFRLNLRTEGVREWNWALRGMDDRSLLAAADLARRHQIWDRAINTADRTQQEHDYSLRFLSPYSEDIRPVAQKQTLDDAWVYGLMRQESRFITQAKSSTGAQGLMQVMPNTASWVANKIGLKNYKPQHLHDRETNVLLGTSYMRLILENLDNHPVLASAGYNAGPGRARQWRTDHPLEGAIYAETIPFSETRDYVKKVMSNTLYYGLLFNHPPVSLKTRLNTIPGRTASTPKTEELP